MQMIAIQKDPVVLWKAMPFSDRTISFIVVHGAISFFNRKKKWTSRP